MSFLRWLQNLRSALTPRRGQAKHRRRAATYRPNVETLDERVLPALVGMGSHLVGQTYVSAMMAGDFNGDGKLDLATANRVLHGTVSVQLGNGDGTFQPAVNSTTGERPNSLAVGDFNSDGKLDLATANDNNTVSVLLGKGDGTFQSPTTIFTDQGPSSIAVGDFNGDGKMDLGVASNAYVTDSPMYYGHWECAAEVLLGNGDGSFSYGADVQFGDGIIEFTAVADFNGDGYDDFATLGVENGTMLNVLLGGNSGAMQEGYSSFSASFYPLSLTAGDVNADGHADLLTADLADGISVLLGNASGGFDSAAVIGQDIESAVLGDFTGDGKLDIAAANGGLFYGNGDGTFSNPETFAAAPSSSLIAAGDFNGDGWLDAATLGNQPVGFGYDNYLNVLINDRSWSSPSAPQVTIDDVTVTEGNTGSVNATFTLSLSAASSQPITLHYATADITATAGSDYTATSGSVTFAPGQTSVTVTVPVRGDRLIEPTETFAVNLIDATNAIIADDVGIGTILDDEPHINIGDATVTEGNTGSRAANFTVTLSAPYDVPLTINYATANSTATAGSDYQARSGMLTIPAGQTSGTIVVQVIGDRIAESNETFFVNLSNPSYGVLSDRQGMGTIVDDEPRISLNDVTMSEGKKGQTTSFTFTVTLSAAYDQAVTMSFKTTDWTATTGDNDYVAKKGKITFNPGETSKTITIVVNGDNKREANEVFDLDLSGNSSNSLFTKSYGIGTILNDD